MKAPSYQEVMTIAPEQADNFFCTKGNRGGKRGKSQKNWGGGVHSLTISKVRFPFFERKIGRSTKNLVKFSLTLRSEMLLKVRIIIVSILKPSKCFLILRLDDPVLATTILQQAHTAVLCILRPSAFIMEPNGNPGFAN